MLFRSYFKLLHRHADTHESPIAVDDTPRGVEHLIELDLLQVCDSCQPECCNSTRCPSFSEALIKRLAPHVARLSDNSVLKLVNQRGAYIPMTLRNLKSSSKRIPLTIEICGVFQNVNPIHPASNSSMMERKRSGLQQCTSSFNGRLTKLEESIIDLPSRHALDVKVDILIYRFQ